MDILCMVGATLVIFQIVQFLKRRFPDEAVQFQRRRVPKEESPKEAV
jgi:hypothetical protein